MGPIGYPKILLSNYYYRLHSNTEQRSSQLLLKSQLTSHKEHELPGYKNSSTNLSSQFTTHTEHNLSQVYRNHGNPDMTSTITIATCLISTYLTYVPSLTLISSP